MVTIWVSGESTAAEAVVVVTGACGGETSSSTADEGVDLGEESKSHLTQHHMYTYAYAYT